MKVFSSNWRAGVIMTIFMLSLVIAQIWADTRGICAQDRCVDSSVFLGGLFVYIGFLFLPISGALPNDKQRWTWKAIDHKQTAWHPGALIMVLGAGTLVVGLLNTFRV